MDAPRWTPVPGDGDGDGDGDGGALPTAPLLSDYDRAVLALQLRYLREVVEAFHFCPFAEAARGEGRVWQIVLPQTDESVEAGVRALTELEALGPSRVAIALLVFPRHAAGLASFSRFAESLKAGYRARFGHERAYVDAVFHPDYQLDPRRAGTVTGFIRKSPDPMLQYTSRAALGAVKREAPPGPLPGGGFRSDAESPVVDQIRRANHRAVLGGEGARRIGEIVAAHARARAEREAAAAAAITSGRPGPR